MKMKASFDLALALVILTFSAAAVRAGDSARPLVGAWAGEFTISSTQDPLAKRYDSWKKLYHLHSDGRFKAVLHFYKNGRMVTKNVQYGRWGSDNTRTFWVEVDFSMQDGVRRESSGRDEYVIDQVGGDFIKYNCPKSGRKYRGKRVSDDFTLP